jgi:hypothetical protein
MRPLLPFLTDAHEPFAGHDTARRHTARFFMLGKLPFALGTKPFVDISFSSIRDAETLAVAHLLRGMGTRPWIPT